MQKIETNVQDQSSPILRVIFDPEGPPDALPCQLIRPEAGDLIWLVDRAAAAGLPAL